MRRAHKTDSNQVKIVAAFRACGWSVAVLSAVGNGIPDLIVARQNRNYLVEIKDGDKPPSQRQLTAMQKSFHATWNGPVLIVESVEDVIELSNGGGKTVKSG